MARAITPAAPTGSICRIAAHTTTGRRKAISRELAQGFAVEVGTPSLASLDSLRAMIPEPDRWPIGDTYAYHDWHFGGNGDTASFMRALQTGFGAATDLEDFERKAQLMNYVTYRAIFEGFQAHLWTRNSGRLLWMTHPAWPSNEWQIYTSDYDTPAAYYAVDKACEPLHAQLDLPDFRPAVVNVTRAAHAVGPAAARVLALDSRVLPSASIGSMPPPIRRPPVEPLDLAPPLSSGGPGAGRADAQRLRPRRARPTTCTGRRARMPIRRLTTLPRHTVLRAHSRADGDGPRRYHAQERGRVPALLAKLTLLDPPECAGITRLLRRQLHCPDAGGNQEHRGALPPGGRQCARVALRGWDADSRNVAIDRPP